MMVERKVIVVGVDSSPSARAALLWAASEARLRNARLRVVHAYALPPQEYVPGFSPMPQEMLEDDERSARRVVEEAAELVRDGVEVTAEALVGTPARLLEAIAADAVLLVVGASGQHNAVAGFVLGGVAQHCVAHALCTVVVVAAPREPVQRDSEPLLAAIQS